MYVNSMSGLEDYVRTAVREAIEDVNSNFGGEVIDVHEVAVLITEGPDYALVLERTA